MKSRPVPLICAAVGMALSFASASAAQPIINHVMAYPKPRAYEGPCPVSIEFVSSIYVNAPTTVSYRWERSDHATGEVQSVQIGGPEASVSTHWNLSRPVGEVYTGSLTLHVLSPGDAYSNPAKFTLICR